MNSLSLLLLGICICIPMVFCDLLYSGRKFDRKDGYGTKHYKGYSDGGGYGWYFGQRNGGYNGGSRDNGYGYRKKRDTRVYNGDPYDSVFHKVKKYGGYGGYGKYNSRPYGNGDGYGTKHNKGYNDCGGYGCSFRKRNGGYNGGSRDNGYGYRRKRDTRVYNGDPYNSVFHKVKKNGGYGGYGGYGSRPYGNRDEYGTKHNKGYNDCGGYGCSFGGFGR